MGGEETRKSLIDAGIKAVQTKSYHGVGIKEVLDQVGVPKGSFYYYFKSKEDFGIAMIESFVEDHLKLLSRFQKDQASPALERFQDYFQACYDYYKANGFCQGCLVSSMSAEAGKMSQAIKDALRRGHMAFQSAYAEFLIQAQAEGHLSTDIDPQRLGGFIYNSWEGSVLRMQIEENLEPLDVFLEFTFGVLLR